MADITPDKSAVSDTLNVSSLNVNLAALLCALLLTVIGVKLTSFLPSKYYFSFSKFVDTTSFTPFLITTPPYITEEKLCDIINSNKMKQITCNDENGDQDSTDADDAAKNAGDDDAAKKKEIRIADNQARKIAQSSDFASNIAGFAIRLSIPLFVGFMIGRLFGPQGELAASTGAAMAAFTLCWPVIVLWDRVVSKAFSDDYGQFLLLYLLYCVSFFYMARIGAIFGAFLIARGPAITLNWSKIIESTTIAIIGGVGAKFVEHLILG